MKSKLIISSITLPVIAGAYFGSAVLSQVAANPADCDAYRDLHGTVSQNVATVKNDATNEACEYDATLAVYDSPQEPETNGWINAQTLIGSKSVKVKAGETVTITVEGNGPSCYNQSDLIRGTEVLTPPVYRDALDTDVYKDSDNCSSVTPTPTVTPTGTPGSTTENKVGGASATKLASTGSKVLTFAVLFAGAVSLLVGLLARKKLANA